MGAELTDPGWHFADQSRTNAEIILRLYRTLRQGAGAAVLLGCNTIGHLGAGIFEIQRTGDDTSGLIWERTRAWESTRSLFGCRSTGRFSRAIPTAPLTPTRRRGNSIASIWISWLAAALRSSFPSTRGPSSPTRRRRFARRCRRRCPAAPSGCEPLDWLHTRLRASGASARNGQLPLGGILRRLSRSRCEASPTAAAVPCWRRGGFVDLVSQVIDVGSLLAGDSYLGFASKLASCVWQGYG